MIFGFKSVLILAFGLPIPFNRGSHLNTSLRIFFLFLWYTRFLFWVGYGCGLGFVFKGWAFLGMGVGVFFVGECK